MAKLKPEQFLRESREGKLPKSAIKEESLKSEVQKLRSFLGKLTLELTKPKKNSYEKENLKSCD